MSFRNSGLSFAGLKSLPLAKKTNKVLLKLMVKIFNIATSCTCNAPHNSQQIVAMLHLKTDSFCLEMQIILPEPFVSKLFAFFKFRNFVKLNRRTASNKI